MERRRNKLFQLLIIWINILASYGYLDELGQCEPIRVDMCSHLKYNMTRMPNFLGHQSQQEAISELRSYNHLVSVLDCSQHLKFLLCSLFVPMCTKQLDGPLVIEVCRSMCLQVKADCEPVLTGLKVDWPLNCSRLPEYSSKEQLCMAPDDVKLFYNTDDSWNNKPNRPVFHSTEVPLPKSTPSQHKAMCPPRYSRYENSTCSDLCNPSCHDCVPNCSDVFFTKQHKKFAYAWSAIWASLCVLSTLFTIAAFCVEPGRFRYPTRPIIFMAFCYLMYSMAYLTRLFIPAEDVICKPDGLGSRLMIVNGMESTLCIIIFLIQYYFGIASHIWWLVLTLTWYLAASRKWGLEAINSIACYFHLFAWAVPAILTIAILVSGRVDSNELTGMCYVGNYDKWSLLIYIIIPMSLLLFVGEIFLLAGFAALFKIRTNLKTQIDNSNIRKLEKLMAKIGVFAILYTVPAVCILGAHVHEFMNMDIWRCLSADFTVKFGDVLTNSIPTVEIHMLKIFMSLVVGITLSMWVLSAKTIHSCERRCCRQKTSLPVIPSAHKNSYIVARPTDRAGYMQHYKFPVRHPGPHRPMHEVTM